MDKEKNFLQEENKTLIQSQLIRTCYSEARIAIIGLIFAISLHIYLMITSGIPGIKFNLALLSTTIALICGVLYGAEKKIQSIKVLSRLLGFSLLFGFSILGFYLVYCLIQIPVGDLRLTTFAIVIGIIGGATLTFTSHRLAFLASSIPLTLSLLFYLFAYGDNNFHNLITGLMVIIYEVVLLGLAERDFRRRRELFVTQLNLKEEKEALAHTLQTVEQLKRQQDGDYFLTSLLLKPLGVNRSKNPKVTVEFLIAQKKRFEFRGKEQEIGGDICIAHDIRLSNRDYTVILNADAMGKSIQGAGGAIVIGSVFHAIIERTKHSREVSSKSPERWLKNTFLELRSVFDSFDGSMMVSTVIGLIDTENGLLYYLNIEHPWNILYRDKKATFIEQSPSHHKLGMSMVNQEVNLMTFLMQPGDVVLLGSDGRDDILVDTTEDDRRVINEDEHQILERIVESEGKLEKIYDVLKVYGELTDDLSFLRIHYAGDTTKVESQEREPKLLIASLLESLQEEKAESLQSSIMPILANVQEKTLARVYNELYKQGEYFVASLVSEHLNNQIPMKTNYLFLASKCLRKANKLQAAADMGERLLLRDPQHVENTIHLAKIHLLLRNKKRSEELLQLTERYNVSNAELNTIKNQLREFDD
ncbi:MAG: PP2C family protein-serine/threonine phosphatase [Spirochaetota bacterium]